MPRHRVHNACQYPALHHVYEVAHPTSSPEAVETRQSEAPVSAAISEEVKVKVIQLLLKETNIARRRWGDRCKTKEPGKAKKQDRDSFLASFEEGIIKGLVARVMGPIKLEDDEVGRLLEQEHLSNEACAGRSNAWDQSHCIHPPCTAPLASANWGSNYQNAYDNCRDSLHVNLSNPSLPSSSKVHPHSLPLPPHSPSPPSSLQTIPIWSSRVGEKLMAMKNVKALTRGAGNEIKGDDRIVYLPGTYFGADFFKNLGLEEVMVSAAGHCFYLAVLAGLNDVEWKSRGCGGEGGSWVNINGVDGWEKGVFARGGGGLRADYNALVRASDPVIGVFGEALLAVNAARRVVAGSADSVLGESLGSAEVGRVRQAAEGGVGMGRCEIAHWGGQATAVVLAERLGIRIRLFLAEQCRVETVGKRTGTGEICVILRANDHVSYLRPAASGFEAADEPSTGGRGDGPSNERD